VHCLDVLLLRDFEELTLAEIARRPAETIASTRRRFHRPRELMLQYWAKLGCEDVGQEIEQRRG
jgi:DNA-directed RNA polymerase specialized sigma24 family protein